MANIAEKVLEEQNPTALKAANDLLLKLGEYNSTWVVNEDKHAFVECATFADDFKYHGEMWQSDFHFIDFPWIEEGEDADYKINLSSRNLTDGMTTIVNWLSGKHGKTIYESAYMYTFLMKKFENNEDAAKSYALRLLIHYMGDLMQPFHCENRFNKKYPSGDKGANAFALKNHYSVSELHALWDKILYDGKNNVARPFTDATWTSFQSDVDNVMTTYADAVKYKYYYQSVKYDDFAKESFDIAITLYDGLTEGEAVPQEYLDKNKPIAYDRLMKGGYRLYWTIDYIFGGSNEVVDQETIAEFLQ